MQKCREQSGGNVAYRWQYINTRFFNKQRFFQLSLSVSFSRLIAATLVFGDILYNWNW